MRKLFKILLKIIIILIIIITIITLYFTISDYNPDKKIIISQGENVTPLENKKITILSWNIGYAGLGNNMDFFYDGGKKVKDTKQQTLKNLNKIKTILDDYSYVDFILLQEVDVNSKRSYYINEKDTISKQLDNFISFFATNYKVQYIPFPISSPLGKVESGLITYSKNIPVSSVRYKYPGNYNWPKKLFLLDRCFICNRYPVNNGKQLIIINTHNSAYDKNGNLRQKQLNFLKKFITQEYNKGNYVIVAGDWNENPPDFNKIKHKKYKILKLKSINKNFMPKDWKWIFDPKTPTNRSLSSRYNKNTTKKTIIDFFLISPNIKNTEIKTINLDFENSDHQPILGEFKLKN